MSLFCCNNKNSCAGFAVVASIIIGIIAAFLSFTAVITITPAFLWVLFGIAIVYLAVTPGISAITSRRGMRNCFCSILPALLIGLLGTILTSVILLGITFAAASVIGAIITGLLIAFFSLTVSLFACLAYCLSDCSDNRSL